jgi:hypothetical protein
VAEIGIVMCHAIVSGNGVYGNFGVEYEPHDEMPISCITIPVFTQGDGNWGPDELMPIRRNVTFGDGHGAYIKQSNRIYKPGSF